MKRAPNETPPRAGFFREADALLRRLNDDRFRLYRAEINARNLNQIELFSLLGLLLGALNAVASLLLSRAEADNTSPAALGFFFYFLVLTLLCRTGLLRSERHVTPLFYLLELPPAALAIALGTFMNPGRGSILILVFLCVLPVFILDRPLHILAFITVLAAAYALCCHAVKQPALFRADMANLVTCWLIAVGVNVSLLFERIDSVETLATYRDKAERDALTGIYNRGGGEKIKLMLRRGTPGAFIIIDVDYFKRVNDTFGHETGDEVLVRLTEIITLHFRASDVIMRLGGDEFIIYAAGMTDRELCRRKLSELQEDTRCIELPGTDGRSVTVSMGCVINDGAEVDYQALYKRADACLYRAKFSGKNRFEIN